ncbi:type II toxin-antitoxin system MqsA family antitoxin [bacterium]|nr:type II toxin-antitoxin system MqsA family antitoxin [bacterium]MCK4325779.1 type II toxin-antitoxin system MqsA family antitoxin [bacterium]MCK4437078.1 type II toxin-antitoxin system MqsA family antitoxin [bacterium]
MTRKYSDCFYCGGAVREELATREYHWKGKLYVFEGVPMGICNQCGEKVLKPEVGKELEKIVLKGEKPFREVVVPVYSFSHV